MKLTFISESVNDTKKLATTISNNLFKGAVISLDGDLGAGKTTFTKYLAKGMGIEEEVSSPTFNILKCYFHKLKVIKQDKNDKIISETKG